MRYRHKVTDRQVEWFIGGLLRAGVIAAATIAVAGGIGYLVRHAEDSPQYAIFRAEPDYLRKVWAVLSGAFALRTDALIQAGLLALIAVPILRVAVSMVAFALERDLLYSLVTALVLGILLFSLLGGRI
ncbi:MAG TPA: DUF1634 domain-containing protein [Spirochaetia bacterium]|nr:DUF1634 domain-containing protein [Spirochaetia bacterium]